MSTSKDSITNMLNKRFKVNAGEYLTRIDEFWDFSLPDGASGEPEADATRTSHYQNREFGRDATRLGSAVNIKRSNV